MNSRNSLDAREPFGTSPVIFDFDLEQARRIPENAMVLEADAARIVLAELADRARTHEGPVTPEIFDRWLTEVQEATGVAREDVLTPVRIALTGSHTGPELATLIPLLESSAASGSGAPGVRERILRFVGV